MVNRVSIRWDVTVVVVIVIVVVVIVVVVVFMDIIDPRNLPLKFCQNRVSNSWDIDDVEFPVVVVGGGGGVKSFSCQTQLLLCWVVVELGMWQFKYFWIIRWGVGVWLNCYFFPNFSQIYFDASLPPLIKIDCKIRSHIYKISIWQSVSSIDIPHQPCYFISQKRVRSLPTQ